MKNIKLNLLSWCLLLIFLPVPGFAFQEEEDRGMTDYLPLTKSETARRFPLKYEGLYTTMEADPDEKVKPKLLSNTLNIGVSGANLSKRKIDDDNEEISIVGNDKNGKEWCVILGGTPALHGFKFYTADLDKNGIQDGLLLADTMGNGMAPTKHIQTLTFDDAGRPILFEIEGFFHEEKDQLFDVVDLNQDGHAEIIYMSHGAGYWVTTLYEINNARWTRISGKFAERSYPLYTRFTNRPNRVAVTPKVGKKPTIDDLSNVTPKFSGILKSYKWADVNQSEDVSMRVKTKEGKEIVCVPASWYSSFSIVIDTANGRRIVSMSAGEKSFRAMLDEVVKNKYEASFFAQRGSENISPEMLWAIGK